MITGVKVVYLGLNDCEQDPVKVQIKIHYLTEKGSLGRVWDRSLELTMPRQNILSLITDVEAFVIQEEQSAWEEIGFVSGIQTYHIDLVRYTEDKTEWGLACSYRRLDRVGKVIAGFDGNILLMVQNGFRMAGKTIDAGKKQGFEALGDKVLAWATQVAATQLQINNWQG